MLEVDIASNSPDIASFCKDSDSAYTEEGGTKWGRGEGVGIVGHSADCFEAAASEKGHLLTHTLLKVFAGSQVSQKSAESLEESFWREGEPESLEITTLEIPFSPDF